MKDLNNQILGLIEETVISERPLVIDSLKKSNVIIDSTISDRELFKKVVEELNNGNGYLIYHFGEVLSKKIEPKSGFDFSLNPSALASASQAASLQNTTTSGQTSGGGFGNWLQSNAGVISAGANILGSFFLGGSGSPSSSSAPTSSQNTALAQFQYAQQQSQLDRERWEREQKAREELQREKTNTTILIFSIIGGVLLIGTIVTVSLLNKKK